MYDIVVIGGGPAGMTAALYAARNGRSALILEKHGFGGQITYSPKVENYPGTMQMSGNEFADRFLDQILAQGVEVELERATSVERKGDHFAVVTEDGGRFAGRAVILATGVKHRMLGLPGEAELVGTGVSFCAVCDGDFYAGQTVAVAGGGNSALQEAILLSQKCREVIVVQDLPALTAEQKLQDVLLARPNVRVLTGRRITGLLHEGETLRGITAADRENGREETVACDGLFVAIGLIPENEAFASLARLDERGYFDAGEDCATGTPGVFVAGDCRRKTVRQLTTAVADGASAAIAAGRYLDGLGAAK